MDLILRNGVLPTSPGASAVAIAGGRIASVGSDADATRLGDANTQVVDCAGRVIIPGIVDDHCHIFATAATLHAVDCRPTAAPTLESMLARLKAAAPRLDGWIRGYGYDDSPLGLGRQLTRHDLDAVSESMPVRVQHRSGHATALNSAGLRAAGISKFLPDPPGGVVERDGAGEPTGVLLEMAGWLRERNGERGADHGASMERNSALRALGQRLLWYGITALTDAGPDNGPERWSAFADAIHAGALRQRVTMMVGHGRLEDMTNSGMTYGDNVCGGRLTVGHAKIMVTLSSGELRPHPEALADLVASAHHLGYPVAIHAVERDAVVAAALAIRDHPSPAGHDRIEHCAECPPDVAELVAESGALAVVNTGFLHYDGERYLAAVSGDLLPHLYPAGPLAALGAPVAIASDSPVVEPNPWASMAAAVSRRTARGIPLGGIGLPSLDDALRRHVGRNQLARGRPADLAVVDPNPFTTPAHRLPEVRSLLTLVNGNVVWRSGI